jgi:glycosyltransferase involved in cell wall biosynthesis
MLKLTIGYSVLAERAKNIKPPTENSWELIVITQGGEAETELSGARYVSLASVGVAKSRNKAIEKANGEYLVFADDDVVWQENGLKEVLVFLDQNQEVSMVLCQAQNQNAQLRKKYPKAKKKLTLWNSAKAATYEMIVRVEGVRKLGVRFDENFGAGVECYLGDEYIFITDLIRAGGTGYFLPITIATHPEDSSGSGWGTKRDRVARAKVFRRVFRKGAPWVRALFGFKRVHELGGVANLVRFIIGR